MRPVHLCPNQRLMALCLGVVSFRRCRVVYGKVSGYLFRQRCRSRTGGTRRARAPAIGCDTAVAAVMVHGLNSVQTNPATQLFMRSC